MTQYDLTRRHALQLGAAMLRIVAGPSVCGADKRTRPAPKAKIRVGFVGIGVKGSPHVRNLLHIDGVEMQAVCDIRPVACAWAQRQSTYRKNIPIAIETTSTVT